MPQSRIWNYILQKGGTFNPYKTIMHPIQLKVYNTFF